MTRRGAFAMVGQEVRPGRRATFELPIARLMSGTPVALPVQVLHGGGDGPTIWVSAALHGDEICGVEIIRRVLEKIDARALRGTIIAVPVVNVHGFNTGDRYLPDRRDLNRSFPGSARGSLASRLAHLMLTEVVGRCSLGIDFHTGSDHRINLPQIRADLDDEPTAALAQVFGAPFAMHSRLRDGSLRQAATDAGARVLLFEGGEADRFDPWAIRVGVGGTMRVLAELGMTDDAPEGASRPFFARSSRWARASRSGILHLAVELGDEVEPRQEIAAIYDPFGKRLGVIRSRTAGVVIGHTQRPLVNRGDAIAHIAEASRDAAVASDS